MEALRLWIMGITFAATVGTVVLVLNPGGGAEKTVKTMVSVFLVCAIVKPLTKGMKLNFYADLPEEEINMTVGNDINGAVTASFGEKLKKSIENLLDKNGIYYSSVSIDIKTDDDEISVERVLIVLDEKGRNQIAETKEIIEKELGIKSEISVTSAGG